MSKPDQNKSDHVFFWACLTGLFHADGNFGGGVAKRSRLTLAGHRSVFTDFLVLGLKLGQPFNVRFGHDQSLYISWSHNRSKIMFLSRFLVLQKAVNLSLPKFSHANAWAVPRPNFSRLVSRYDSPVPGYVFGWLFGDGQLWYAINNNGVSVNWRISQASKAPLIDLLNLVSNHTGFNAGSIHDRKSGGFELSFNKQTSDLYLSWFLAKSQTDAYVGIHLSSAFLLQRVLLTWKAARVRNGVKKPGFALSLKFFRALAWLRSRRVSQRSLAVTKSSLKLPECDLLQARPSYLLNLILNAQNSSWQHVLKNLLVTNQLLKPDQDVNVLIDQLQHYVSFLDQAFNRDAGWLKRLKNAKSVTFYPSRSKVWPNRLRPLKRFGSKKHASAWLTTLET